MTNKTSSDSTITILSTPFTTINLLELLNTIDSIAFHNLDDRLSQLLKQKSEKEGSELKTTHQELANQLNSSREVISRLLKQMERKGKIQMGRNKITLL